MYTTVDNIFITHTNCYCNNQLIDVYMALTIMAAIIYIRFWDYETIARCINSYSYSHVHKL